VTHPQRHGGRAGLGLALVILFVASACAKPESPTPAAPSGRSASPSAILSPTPRLRSLSADAAKVLAYLGRLSDDTEPGVIVGQDCPQLDGICGDASYRATIGALHDQSGKWVGILHLDYEFVRQYSAADLSTANRRLISHWRAGGLAAVSWGPVNPWGGRIDEHVPGADLRELLPGGAKRDQWMTSLSRIADALTELRDAGVVVLWRPMQEMNGPIYWWAKTQLGDQHEVYGEIWRDMFDYFTYERDLDNLLWVFAPMVTQAWSSFPYPGDACVDVVAGTYYSNTLEIPSYYDFLAYGKPIGMSEYGPDPYGLGGEPIGANGSFDDRKYVERLRRDYPRVAYFAAWSSWPGIKMSLPDNLHARELMNDPDVITRDEIDWR
jgi:mannan endo-1,4-beta-mannosidase